MTIDREGQSQVWMLNEHVEQMRRAELGYHADALTWCRGLVELNPPPLLAAEPSELDHTRRFWAEARSLAELLARLAINDPIDGLKWSDPSGEEDLFIQFIDSNRAERSLRLGFDSYAAIAFRRLVELNPPPIRPGMWVEGADHRGLIETDRIYVADVWSDNSIIAYYRHDEWQSYRFSHDQYLPCDPHDNAQELYDLLDIEGPEA